MSRSPLRHVAKRLDVLVMDSGEFELPDEVRLRDIGVPRGVACACLAETVVLAPENRYETSTVGRDIDWVKVKEIYRLGLKHRMKPSAISGVNGVFTHDDFAPVRESPSRAGPGPRPPRSPVASPSGSSRLFRPYTSGVPRR